MVLISVKMLTILISKLLFVCKYNGEIDIFILLRNIFYFSK